MKDVFIKIKVAHNFQSDFKRWEKDWNVIQNMCSPGYTFTAAAAGEISSHKLGGRNGAGGFVEKWGSPTGGLRGEQESTGILE